MNRLAHEGFVYPIPRLGYIVSLITADDVHEIFETRSVLETATARLACLHGNEERLHRITGAANFTYEYKNRQSYIKFLDQNKGFHLSIAEATENRRLTELVSRSLDELTRVFHLGLDLRDSANEMRDDHLALAQAIQNRDANLAVQLIQKEIDRSQQRVLEALSNLPRWSTAIQARVELGRRL